MRLLDRGAKVKEVLKTINETVAKVNQGGPVKNSAESYSMLAGWSVGLSIFPKEKESHTSMLQSEHLP